MSYIGDFALSSNVDLHFTTVNTSGVPTQLAGTPVVSAYPDNSTTQLTAGITLTVDFDTVTGLNHVRVAATGANGYAAGSTYTLVITTGTVSGSSVVGYVIGSFSIEARSALRPTTAGRTLDVTATGEAGIDWANIGGPTTTVNLSGTTVKTATDVETDTADIQSRLPAALVSGRIDASVGAMAANTLTAAALAADAVTEIQSGLATDADMSTVLAALAAILDDTGTSGVIVATNNDKTGYALSATGSAALTEGYRTNGAAGTLPELLYEVIAHLGESTIAGTTKTIKKIDHSTTAETFTLDDATTPTSITRAT